MLPPVAGGHGQPGTEGAPEYPRALLCPQRRSQSVVPGTRGQPEASLALRQWTGTWVAVAMGLIHTQYQHRAAPNAPSYLGTMGVQWEHAHQHVST